MIRRTNFSVGCIIVNIPLSTGAGEEGPNTMNRILFFRAWPTPETMSIVPGTVQREVTGEESVGMTCVWVLYASYSVFYDVHYFLCRKIALLYSPLMSQVESSRL